MIYGSPCWYPIVENLKELENVQKKCVKWINNGYDVNESYKDIHATYILTISLYLYLQNLLLLHKCINGAYGFDCSDYVSLKDPAHDLRSENDIVFERKPRLFKCEQNFFIQSRCACQPITKE